MAVVPTHTIYNTEYGLDEQSFVEKLTKEECSKILIMSTMFPQHNFDIITDKKNNRTGFLAYDIEFGIHNNYTVSNVINTIYQAEHVSIGKKMDAVAKIFDGAMCIYTEELDGHYETFVGYIDIKNKHQNLTNIHDFANAKQNRNQIIDVNTIYRFIASKGEIIKNGISKKNFIDEFAVGGGVNVPIGGDDFFLIPDISDPDSLDDFLNTKYHKYSIFDALKDKNLTHQNRMNWSEFNDNFTFYKNILQSLRKFGKSYDSVAKQQNILEPKLQSLNDGVKNRGKIANYCCVLCRKQNCPVFDADHLLALAPQQTFLINDQVLSYMYICSSCNRHFKSNKMFSIDKTLWDLLSVNAKDTSLQGAHPKTVFKEYTFTANEALIYGNTNTRGNLQGDITDLHINIFFCLRFIELYDIIISNRTDFENIHNQHFGAPTTLENITENYAIIAKNLYKALVASTKEITSQLEYINVLVGPTKKLPPAQMKLIKQHDEDFAKFSESTEAVKKRINELIKDLTTKDIGPDVVIPTAVYSKDQITDFLSWDLSTFTSQSLMGAAEYHQRSTQAAAQLSSFGVHETTIQLATKYPQLRRFLEAGVELKSLAITLTFLQEKLTKHIRDGGNDDGYLGRLRDARGRLITQIKTLMDAKKTGLLQQFTFGPTLGEYLSQGGQGKLIKYKKTQRKNKKTKKRHKRKKNTRQKGRRKR